MPNKIVLASMAIAGALSVNAAQKNEAAQVDACEEARSFMEKNRTGIKKLLNQQTDIRDVKLLFDLGKFQVEMLETQLAKKDNAVFLCESILKKIKSIINKAATIEKIMNTKEVSVPPIAQEEAKKIIDTKEEAPNTPVKKKGCGRRQAEKLDK